MTPRESGIRLASNRRLTVMCQDIVPEALAGKRFYEPKNAGAEKDIKEKLETLPRARSASASDPSQR